MLQPTSVAPEITWRIGDLHVAVSLYATALAAGVAVSLLVAVGRARRPDVVLVLAPLAAAAGVGGAEASHAILHASPGLSSMGGIAAGLGVLAASARLAGASLPSVLDAIVPGAVAGFGVGRIGCFLAGCCYGRPTALPWAVVFPALGPPARHPVQLYAAVGDFAIAWWSARGARAPGRSAACGMIGYGVLRLALDAARDPDATDRIAGVGPSVAQLGAIVLVVLGLAIARRPRNFLDRTSAPVGS